MVGARLCLYPGVEAFVELAGAFKDRKISWLSNLCPHDNGERNGAKKLYGLIETQKKKKK